MYFRRPRSYTGICHFLALSAIDLSHLSLFLQSIPLACDFLRTLLADSFSLSLSLESCRLKFLVRSYRGRTRGLVISRQNFQSRRVNENQPSIRISSVMTALLETFAASPGFRS